MTSSRVVNNRDGHVTGLTQLEGPQLESIERRRLQMWTLTLVLLVSIVAFTSAFLYWVTTSTNLSSKLGLIYLSLMVLVLLFSIFAVKREFQLRSMTAHLIDERVLIAGLTNSLRETNILIESGKDANIRLDIQQVYQAILDCSIDLLEGRGGSIMTLQGPSELHTICSSGLSAARGARVALNEGIAGRVAADREPVLIGGTIDWKHYRADEQEARSTSALCVPLTSGERLVGVLSINAQSGRIYTQRDLRALKSFGEQAGAAIARAESYEATRKIRRQGQTQAMHDPLTGLPNRSLLLDRVGNALARRRPPDRAVVLMFLDLDDFKRVNDSLGHTAGDEVLVAFAERLRSSVRAGDSVGHFGGDEFAILLEATDAEEAIGAANRILGDLQKPFQLEDREVRFSASVGIALEYSSEIRAEELTRRAFNALHSAKNSGRGQIAIFEESMQASAMNRLDLEQDLRRAVDEKSLDVYFQPMMDLEDLSVHGFEALVRWNHPVRGLIAAFSFVPLAEEAGLQPRIDRMVLQESCARVKELNSGLFAANPISAHVNLSPNTIREPDFVSNLALDLHNSGLDPDQLVLEITEGVIMHDVEQAASKLRAIKSLGVRLALDDFGTGYSSLSYLRSFPVDVVKVDKVFVDEIETDDGAAALVQAILRLGSGLTFEVVAEGIETENQMKSLVDLGCRYGQGYYLARPLSNPQLAEFLKKVHGPS